MGRLRAAGAHDGPTHQRSQAKLSNDWLNWKQLQRVHLADLKRVLKACLIGIKPGQRQWLNTLA